MGEDEGIIGKRLGIIQRRPALGSLPYVSDEKMRAHLACFGDEVAVSMSGYGVFLDYNQNAKDRTTCSAYSVRPLADARVSTPLAWDELTAKDDVRGRYTVQSVPQRLVTLKEDPWADYVAAAQNVSPSMWRALDRK